MKRGSGQNEIKNTGYFITLHTEGSHTQRNRSAVLRSALRLNCKLGSRAEVIAEGTGLAVLWHNSEISSDKPEFGIETCVSMI
jgi:hypothetical protein